MAQFCTGGVTTTGALKFKETANLLNGVFQCERTETATKDEVFGYDTRTDKVFGVPTRPMLLSKHEDASALFLFSIRVAFDVTSMKGVTVASEHKRCTEAPWQGC